MSLQFLVSTVVDSAEFGPNPNYLPAQFKECVFLEFQLKSQLTAFIAFLMLRFPRMIDSVEL